MTPGKPKSTEFTIRNGASNELNLNPMAPMAVSIGAA